MTTARILARLSKAPTEFIPLEEIAVNETDLQKRRPDALDEKQSQEDQRQRKELIKSIAESLTDDEQFESTPVRVVRCTPEPDDEGDWFEAPEGNYLVDGFHRYQAYRDAGRTKIPVQRVEGSWAEAHEAATAMNNHTRTVGVGKAQQLQQAWEMVNRFYDHELSQMQNGWSARRIHRAVGISRQTVDNMVSKAKELGRGASSLSWKEAKSSTNPEEIDAKQRLKFIVTRTLELAELAHEDHEIDAMLQVLSDFQSGALGYAPDLDEYVERLLTDSPDFEAF